eukprot:CAMPEP_0172519282 /NCGR_PEP_ID=MMETSP1066-20121228/291329_1 /TAXON_ID=671091 /ORGANISM="Coscinodiscus wailesii, Strain CCMP2513" /LENGTH=100 /DNA_ID=CAMNT_0013301845 /DNA_START=619 /DNA_END=922 /DNA_ORIENTATION=-
MGSEGDSNDIPPNAILAAKREYKTTYCGQRQLYTSVGDYQECETTHCHAAMRTWATSKLNSSGPGTAKTTHADERNAKQSQHTKSAQKDSRVAKQRKTNE